MLRFFISFVVSFTLFRIVLSLVTITTYIGIFFLILFGVLLALHVLRSGLFYGAALGFVWSFWVGLYKGLPVDYYEPKTIGLIEVYITLNSSIGVGIVLGVVGFILTKLYPARYMNKIETVLGLLTILVAILCLFVPVLPREGLKPEEPSPKTLREIFNLR